MAPSISRGAELVNDNSALKVKGGRESFYYSNFSIFVFVSSLGVHAFMLILYRCSAQR